MTLKRAGLPSGHVRCVLKVPSLNLRREIFFSFGDGTRKLRRILHQWIPASEEAREGATFAIRAEVRHRDNQGYRWIVLGRWQAGEPINRAVEEARSKWVELTGKMRRWDSIDAMTEWFARPVLHVSNVEESLRFYVERLGFTVAWQFEEQGRVFVAQVDRAGCSLIFSDQWPEKVGKGLMFISLNVEPETYENAVATIDALRAELEGRGAPVKDGRWGYRLLVVDDPDGNQLFFNYPHQP